MLSFGHTACQALVAHAGWESELFDGSLGTIFIFPA
jgi:hypothetical protein